MANRTSQFSGQDPNDRFVDLAERLGLARTTGVIDPTVVREVIKTAPDVASAKQSVAEHIANRSTLTKDLAMGVVNDSFARIGGDKAALSDPSKAANAVSADATAAAQTFSGNLVLSDPVMLGPGARMAGAAVMGLGLIMSIGLVSTLSATATNWAYGALGGLGLGCLIGAAILIMGYKNVTITGSGSPTGN